MVPFGFVPNAPVAGGNAPAPAFPAGFDPKPSPYGVSLTGLACSEPRLLELAYAPSSSSSDQEIFLEGHACWRNFPLDNFRKALRTVRSATVEMRA